MGISDDLNEYQRTTDKNLQQYQDVINKNTGTAGFNTALTTARNQSQQGAVNQTASATNQAIQAAQQAGMSKAASAMNAGNTAANTYANAYNSAVGNNLASIQNYQMSQVQGASDIYNKQHEAANTKLQTAIADYQRKMQHVQQVIQIAMKVGSGLASKGRATGGATGRATGSNADIATSAQSSMANPSYTATYGNQQGLMNFNTAPSTFNSGFNVNSQNMTMPQMGTPSFYSDVTLKEAVGKAVTNKEKTPEEKFFEKLNALQFKYTDEAQDELGVDDEKHIGLSAQEVEQADPDMVVEKDGHKAIDTQKLVEATAAALIQLEKKLNVEEDGGEE